LGIEKKKMGLLNAGQGNLSSLVFQGGVGDDSLLVTREDAVTEKKKKNKNHSQELEK